MSRHRAAVLGVVMAVALGGCSGGGGPAPTTTAGAPVVVPGVTSTTTAATSTSAGAPVVSVPVVTLPPASARVTVGRIDVPIPAGWKAVPGKDSTTIDNEKVKGTDSVCLQAPATNTDGIPFGCTGVLVLTRTAFDNSSEGQTPYNPDSAYQWYPGTDVPACEPDYPLVQSKIVESALAPISGKNAAFRRLQIQCEKRPTVHDAVTWTLPQSHIALVSLFHPDEARAVFAGARLV
jgi:hypothetical protein